MHERDIVKKIREHLISKYGATCHKHHGGPYSERGVADLFGTFPGGRAYFFEVKVPGKKATLWQIKWLEEEHKRGAVTGVVTSVEEVETILSTISTGLYTNSK